MNYIETFITYFIGILGQLITFLNSLYIIPNVPLLWFMGALIVISIFITAFVRSVKK